MPVHRLIPDVRRSEDLSDGKSVTSSRIRPTRVEIDLAALAANAARVKELVGAAGVLAVVKADAYGHGAIPAARALREHAPIAGLAVSLAEEGFELRRAGIPGPILVMGGVYGVTHRELVAHGLTPVVSELADVEAFARAGVAFDLHVKLDTGMARLGVRPEHLEAFLDGIAAFPNARIAGFMTHLASADVDPDLTRLQLERFAAAAPSVRARAGGPLTLHAANTAGVYASPAAQIGYRDGVEAGRDDARGRQRNDPRRSKRYRNGDHEYNARYGSLDQYKQEYRAAFQQGYEEGYRDVRR